MNTYPTNQLPGRTVKLTDGKEYLYFSGTDYLGMGHHEKFISWLTEGFSLYGTHFGSSRNNSLRLDIYKEVEMALAQYMGAPAALSVSSGMWAGQLLMKELEAVIQADIKSSPYASSRNYYYAPGVHPALRGENYTGDGRKWIDWVEETIQFIGKSNPEDVHVIVSDAISSPFVEHFDFSVFHQLPFYRNIYLLVDDSHGLGVRGKDGAGVYEQLSSIQQVKWIVTSSLNKALGIPAGVIVADPQILQVIQNSPFFAGASPAAPAYFYALKNLLENRCYQEAYQKLQGNLKYITRRLSATHLFVSLQGYPVFCSRDPRLFDFLEQNGILGSCFSYPNADDPPVSRIVITALHQKEDLDRLAEVCELFQNQL